MALQKETTEVERERIIADCYTYRGRMAHTVICMLIGSLKVKMDRPNYFAFLVFLAHEEDDGILGQTNRKVDNGIPRIFFQITFSHHQKSKRMMTIAVLCNTRTSSLFRLSRYVPTYFFCFFVGLFK